MQIRKTTVPRAKLPAASSTLPAVGQLLARRGEILGWLTRLDEEGGSENPRVVERIRSDYQQRLHRVVQELTEHVAAIRAELSDARERLQHADARFVEAEDALHEARLRHRIGELSPDEWQARRGDLEQAVEAAAGERSGAAAEVVRFEEVLAQVDAGPGAAAAPQRDAPVADSRQDRRAEPVASVPPPPAVEAPTAAPPVAAAFHPAVEVEPSTPAAEHVEQDFAFLEKLDRAIATSAPPVDGLDEEDEAEEEEDEATRPPKGAKCPECGYTNDFEAWYCGVCGVDLA